MKPEQLALPAPVEAIEIPGMNTIPTMQQLSQLDTAR
jgi:hypothetical protein